jgi:hypothetical protein
MAPGTQVRPPSVVRAHVARAPETHTTESLTALTAWSRAVVWDSCSTSAGAPALAAARVARSGAAAGSGDRAQARSSMSGHPRAAVTAAPDFERSAGRSGAAP